MGVDESARQTVAFTRIVTARVVVTHSTYVHSHGARPPGCGRPAGHRCGAELDVQPHGCVPAAASARMWRQRRGVRTCERRRLVSPHPTSPPPHTHLSTNPHPVLLPVESLYTSKYSATLLNGTVLQLQSLMGRVLVITNVATY